MHTTFSRAARPLAWRSGVHLHTPAWWMVSILFINLIKNSSNKKYSQRSPGQMKIYRSNQWPCATSGDFRAFSQWCSPQHVFVRQSFSIIPWAFEVGIVCPTVDADSEENVNWAPQVSCDNAKAHLEFQKTIESWLNIQKAPRVGAPRAIRLLGQIPHHHQCMNGSPMHE